MNRLRDMLDLFSGAIDQVYHSNDPSLATGERRGSLVAIFSIRKQARR